MTIEMEDFQIDDMVWLLEFTHHKYVKYVVKRAIITDIEISIWKGGKQTLYQTDLTSEPDREDMYLSRDDAVNECEKRNESAKQYRATERKRKRPKQQRIKFKGQMLVYNDEDWQDLLAKRQTGAKE